MPMLSLNGEAVQADTVISVACLLEQQGYEAKKIAVAINGEFVPRSEYGNTDVNDGDEVDVIQAVGGG